VNATMYALVTFHTERVCTVQQHRVIVEIFTLLDFEKLKLFTTCTGRNRLLSLAPPCMCH
jgi:hypothetical protein